jgi:hypothetical protein
LRSLFAKPAPTSLASSLFTMQPSKLSRSLPALILVCSLSAIYWRTLAPGLTWANRGYDGGDLIAAAATGGVAHPTGYPLYLLLARVFQFLPPGPLAFRTNLMSAAAAVLAALTIYTIVMRYQSSRGMKPSWLSGLAAAYAFGLAPVVWSQAVITEVYTLQACLIALLLYAYTSPVPVSSDARRRLDTSRGLLLGLATCNQIVTILILPLALVLGAFHARPETGLPASSQRPWLRNWSFDGVALRRQLLFLGLGLSLYLILPLRAWAGPPVNWGYAVTPARLWWLISGELYQGHYLQFDPSVLWERVQASAGLLLEQTGLLGLVLGVTGLVIFSSTARLYILSTWVAAISLTFAILYSSDDSYVYLIPFLVSFAVWIGLGLDELLRILLGRFPRSGLALGLVVVGFFVGQALLRMNQIDASADRRAESFGKEALAAAPENAVVFAKGDRAVFALWYFHFALGERPDLAVLAEDLLHFDWYQENLHDTYPSLVVPGPFPWPETLTSANPSRPVCYMQYTDRAEIDCQMRLSSP